TVAWGDANDAQIGRRDVERMTAINKGNDAYHDAMRQQIW
ncbi:hypothetical protein CCACVL1_18213, partial [Corchorus capsularis]